MARIEPEVKDIQIGDTGFNATYFAKMSEDQFMAEFDKPSLVHVFAGYDDRQAALKDAYARIHAKAHPKVKEAATEATIVSVEEKPAKAKK